MVAIKRWIIAFRLRTLPLALASVIMGSFLAAESGDFSWAIFTLCCLTTILLQVLSNLANDFGDSQNGADHGARKGPDRMVQAGLISAQAMKRSIILFVILSLISGISLLYVSFDDPIKILLFLIVGLAAIGAAVKYTVGKNPYGYIGFGDISVLLFFGLVGVCGTYFLYTQSFEWSILLPSLASGFLAVGVLNVNNIRDIQSDKQAGKLSIPVRIGKKRAVMYHWMLLSGALLLASLFTFLRYESVTQWLFLIAGVPLFVNGRAVYKYDEAKKLDPYLKQLALSALFFNILFGIGLLF